MTDSTPVDKDALAREARSVLGNLAFRRAVKAIYDNTITEMLRTTDDNERRILADRANVILGIEQLLEAAILDSKPTRPRSIA